MQMRKILRLSVLYREGSDPHEKDTEWHEITVKSDKWPPAPSYSVCAPVFFFSKPENSSMEYEGAGGHLSLLTVISCHSVSFSCGSEPSRYSTLSRRILRICIPPGRDNLLLYPTESRNPRPVRAGANWRA